MPGLLAKTLSGILPLIKKAAALAPANRVGEWIESAETKEMR
jgi:hypothetical protein